MFDPQPYIFSHDVCGLWSAVYCRGTCTIGCPYDLAAWLPYFATLFGSLFACVLECLLVCFVLFTPEFPPEFLNFSLTTILAKINVLGLPLARLAQVPSSASTSPRASEAGSEQTAHCRRGVQAPVLGARQATAASRSLGGQGKPTGNLSGMPTFFVWFGQHVTLNGNNDQNPAEP